MSHWTIRSRAGFATPPPGGMEPPAMRDWAANGGPEAIARLPDGRFIVLSEDPPWLSAGERPGLLFPAAVVGPLIVPLMLFHQIQLMVCAVMARRYAAGFEVEAATGLVEKA